MILFLIMACLETAPHEAPPQLSLCDRLSLQMNRCGDVPFGESLRSRCFYFPSQRVELSACLNRSCDELASCLSTLKEKGWTPESDPGFCDAFRSKKMGLNRLLHELGQKEPIQSARRKEIFWVAGAECETDKSLALKCYDKEGVDMLNCILNSSEMLPTLSVSAEKR